VTADRDMIREAYKREAFANHPDRAVNEQDRKERTARFQKINEANFVLSNEQRVLLFYPPPDRANRLSAKNTTNLAAIPHPRRGPIIDPPMRMLSLRISSRKYSARIPMRLVFPTRQAGSTKSPGVHREQFWALLSPISPARSVDL